VEPSWRNSDLRDEHRFMVYKKTVLLTIFGPEREGGREGGSWKKLCIEEPNYLYSSLNMIIIK
jgi:hypothetical protein